MPTVIKYCDKTGTVIGNAPTVELRDDHQTGNWNEITINDLLHDMEFAKKQGVTGALHLKNDGVTYSHFCPGCSNMTLIGNSTTDAEYKLSHPRTYACLHIIQPRKLYEQAQDRPDLFIRLSFEAIAKARYSAWWDHLEPRIWKRTGIGAGHLPNGGKATAAEIAINFCVDIV
jgi:hypothetical protein